MSGGELWYDHKDPKSKKIKPQKTSRGSDFFTVKELLAACPTTYEEDTDIPNKWGIDLDSVAAGDAGRSLRYDGNHTVPPALAPSPRLCCSCRCRCAVLC